MLENTTLKNGIVIVNSTNQTKVYTFDDEGKDSLKEIETSIAYEVEKNKQSKTDRNNEQNQEKQDEKEQDEGRTPWGDAEARRRY